VIRKDDDPNAQPLVVQKTAEPIEKAWFTQDSSSIKSKIERGNF
jgi:hypothetical protein